MTATLPDVATITRTDYDVPAQEPDDGKRASVKAWRRELADWLRAHGIGATGPAWASATFGERDLTTLRRIAADSGDDGALVRHWAGYVMPSALTSGDMTDWGIVAGGPVSDPETGAVWIVATRSHVGATDHDAREAVTATQDVELTADIPVRVTRGKGDLTAR